MKSNKIVTTTEGDIQSCVSLTCVSLWLPSGRAAGARRGSCCRGLVGARDREVLHELTHLAQIRKKQSSLHIHNAFFIVYTRLGMIYWVGYIHMKNDVKWEVYIYVCTGMCSNDYKCATGEAGWSRTPGSGRTQRRYSGYNCVCWEACVAECVSVSPGLWCRLWVWGGSARHRAAPLLTNGRLAFPALLYWSSTRVLEFWRARCSKSYLSNHFHYINFLTPK